MLLIIISLHRPLKNLEELLHWNEEKVSKAFGSEYVRSMFPLRSEAKELGTEHKLMICHDMKGKVLFESFTNVSENDNYICLNSR